MNLLINANAKHIPLVDNSVNCVVTSPPYYGLRDYGIGDQIGLEQSPDDYVEAMCQVFDEVWRVLRDDGTVWLNLGDSYVSAPVGQKTVEGLRNSSTIGMQYKEAHLQGAKFDKTKIPGLKTKDLIGIPWRVAFALQARGWYLRQDIIWHKPNPMPESVKDRCTKAHEYIFLLTKSARYWYDNEAVKEPHDDTSWASEMRKMGIKERQGSKSDHNSKTDNQAFLRGNPRPDGGRNKRSVWSVTTKPYPGSHYAVFPPDLIEPCVLAGCPETVCAECGAPYERVVEYELGDIKPSVSIGVDKGNPLKGGATYREKLSTKTLGFQPTCTCDAGTKAGVVLDPFVGSGTTCMVARKHRRHGIGLDLNFTYLTTNARERLTYGDFVPVADGITQLTIGGA